MTPASALNDRLAASHPAASACLSALGRAIFYPKGITAQAEQARGSRINATLGQLTDGAGGAMGLPGMVRHLGDLPPERALLYAAQGGIPDLRAAWKARLSAAAGPAISLPLVTTGITHGLATVADLFAGPDTDVLLPEPGWGNYKHIFGTRRGARLLGYGCLGPSGFDVAPLRRALAALTRPTVLVLNYPSNPIGYVPDPVEADAIVAAVAEAPVPLVVVTDDAYQGMVWEPGRVQGSLFARLCRLDPARVLPVKVDGATKELFFFGGRVGFVTFGCGGSAAEVLEDKAMGLLRATTSSGPAFSQALVLEALANPALDEEREVLHTVLRGRYQALRASLDQAGITPWPYNGAFFVFVPVKGDAEALRLRLLDQGVGVIAFADAGAIRLSYASIKAELLPELVSVLARNL